MDKYTQPTINLESPSNIVDIPRKFPLKVVLVCTALFLILGIGALMLSRNIAYRRSASPSPTIPTPMPTDATTVGWLPYKSALVGISMEYPPSVKVEEHINERAVYFSEVGPTIKSNTESYGLALRIAAYTPASGKTLQESIQMDLENAPTNPTVIEPLSETQFNGYKAYVMKVQNMQRMTVWYVDKGNEEYLIITDSSQNLTDDQRFIETATEILSTIRIISN